MTSIPYTFRKIVVPTDFSDLSKHAFMVALQLAQKSGARLKLLNIIEMPMVGDGFGAFYSGIEMSPVSSYQSYDLILPDLLEQARLQINKLVEIGLNNGVIMEQEVVADVAVSKICNVVLEEQADLVVIGSEGAAGLEEFLIGSDAEELVRQCTCPVLTIKQSHTDFQVKNILFPSDFTVEVDAIIPYLRFYQQFFEAHLDLLYVRTKNDQATDPEIHERMQSFVDRCKLTDVNLIIQPYASASGGILETVTTMAPDLILMPTHGRTGLANLFHKSIAESVVNHASVPVLTCHWPAKSR